jgi:uncharacterized protein (TIGR00245 family)
MLCADAGVELVVLSAAAGRTRVHAIGFRHNAAWAAAIEETVSELTGVRAVRAYPRTESVVVWYAPGDCDTAAVLSAIARVQNVPAASAGTRISHSPVARRQGSMLSKLLGGLAQTLLNPHRDADEAPPEIERLRAALDRIGFLAPQTGSQAALVKEVGPGRVRIHPRWMWLAVPLGLVAVRLTGFGLHSLKRWAAVIGPQAGRSRRVRVSRNPSPLAVIATGLAVPSWGGVVVSLLLVSVAGAVAYRRRLGLTREVVVAAGRAAVQLVTAGALLRVLFQRPSLLGPAGWLLAMVIIAGQVAGRRGAGLPRARLAATGGVAASTVGTLFVLLAGRVIAVEARVIVPVGGMIVSSAMLAAGGALRRLDDDVRQSRPAIEARLSLGQSGRQAILPYQRSALRTALIPAIDSTKVVGLISLPGAMTGLILAGISPFTAIRYQIVVMYMQLAATAMAALIAVRLAEESLFDDAQRLIQVNRPDEPS